MFTFPPGLAGLRNDNQSFDKIRAFPSYDIFFKGIGKKHDVRHGFQARRSNRNCGVHAGEPSG
jgi:hypothetical protein